MTHAKWRATTWWMSGVEKQKPEGIMNMTRGRGRRKSLTGVSEG